MGLGKVVGEPGEVQSGTATRYSHPKRACGEGPDALGVDSRPFLRFLCNCKRCQFDCLDVSLELALLSLLSHFQCLWQFALYDIL